MSSPTNGVEKLSPSDFWSPPSTDGKYRTGLVVNNSMAGGKVEFVPNEKGKRITWYGCGPTVYDSAHMGHARTYLAFDIIRRILADYFGYEIFMCMNITDIDDKIIKRSVENGVDFAALARYWEGMFFEDMKVLNVQLPDVITRVSEYVPEVLTFIEGIMKNGFAYESQGSVYFDTQAFRAASHHVYGRMEPSSVNDQAKVLEGEGELGMATEKRSPLDFALWKKAKEGEPFWSSPWGDGRPGWHIECSAMASAVLGFPIDIHSGGIDLRFPHHDNELAQSEACYNKPQWVNYFLHSGHLHIKGSKMSKSLKNFITIKQALEVFSPRSIRILTLMHRWDAPMNYSTDGESMVAAAEVDNAFLNFFGTVTAAVRGVSELSKFCQRWSDSDIRFHEKVMNTQSQIHAALSDNFDTPTALLALRSLVTDTHVYIKCKSKAPLIAKAARYVFRILKIFGVTNGSESELDYVAAGGDSEVETKLMDCLSNYRQNIRSLSKDSEAILLVKKLLQFCDSVRDNDLVEVGIQLEDMPEGPVWKKNTREELVREKERKLQEEERRKEQKAENDRLKADAKAKKEAEVKISPSDYFRVLQKDQYLNFDENGIPTVNSDGTAVSKSKRDKLIKLVEKHRIAHDAWIATQQG
ncbi:cysteine--tRNA ligase, cytoplasmic-like [Condylostylus longicornis]|uniref:cysteine--tRNA ligase, cytoplasmic-like n=1 Tax=Condylostylus longicornis TaxID=2530218 RepID=UPI00244E5771|nr:cysteine--tRNA ligase, cytoplasmic-like [Condylostylus longicornis]